MNSYTKRGGAARRRFLRYLQKTWGGGGGGNLPPPPGVRVLMYFIAIHQSLDIRDKQSTTLN